LILDLINAKKKYFSLRYNLSINSIIYHFATIEMECNDEISPIFGYFWYESYFNKVEYFRINSTSKDYKSFKEVENDYLFNKRNHIEKLIEKFNKERELFYKENGYWWID
jgi:hypothetical protein